MLMASAIVGLLILGVLAGIFWIGLTVGDIGSARAHFGFDNFSTVLSRPATWLVLGNTVGFSIYTQIFALLFGLPIAWLAERSDLPGRGIIFGLMTISLLIPGYTSAMGWLFLLHPRIGVLNKLFTDFLGFSAGPFDVASIAGMGWVQGLNLAPLAFIMVAATFRAMDPVLEEAASMSGAGFVSTLWRVTLRLAGPGIFAATIYIFMIGFAAFDVPAVIGWTNRIFTFSSYAVLLINSLQGLPQYGAAAALSVPIIAIAIGLGWSYNRMQSRAQRYAVVTGKGYRPRLIALGRWRGAAWSFIAIYVVLGFILPLLMLAWAAFLPYLQLPTLAAFSQLTIANFRAIAWSYLFEAAAHTAILMVAAATLTVILSLASSWIVLRSKIPGRPALDFVMFLPHVVPNVIFSVAVLLITLFLVDRIVPIYGTLWILLIVFVIGRISYGTRMTNSGLIQLHGELFESARVNGASTGSILLRIVVPLMMPTLVYAWIWTALLCYRELTLATVLTTGDNLTLPVLIWQAWYDGKTGTAAAQSLVMLAFMMPLLGLYWLGGRGQSKARLAS
jgi:iron(III) transport system permease protein